MIEFFVPGRAKAQGSLGSFKHPKTGKIVTPQNKNVISWRGVVATCAMSKMAGRALMQGPVKIMMTFLIERPKCHFGSGKNSTVLKPDAPKFAYGHSTGDGDKLMRSILDALTGVVWHDDCQAARWAGTKRYCGDFEKPGVYITVEQEEDTRYFNELYKCISS